MKRILIFLCLFALTASPGFAFLYRMEFLNPDQIRRMSDQELIDTYIEVKIEREAVRTFHEEAGFQPNDYRRFKDLLSYLVSLRQEILYREKDIDQIDAWLPQELR